MILVQKQSIAVQSGVGVGLKTVTYAGWTIDEQIALERGVRRAESWNFGGGEGTPFAGYARLSSYGSRNQHRELIALLPTDRIPRTLQETLQVPTEIVLAQQFHRSPIDAFIFEHEPGQRGAVGPRYSFAKGLRELHPVCYLRTPAPCPADTESYVAALDITDAPLQVIDWSKIVALFTKEYQETS